MERCKKCVLPVSAVPVNDQGVCQLCASYNEKIDWQRLESDFQNIVHDLKTSKGGRYDCMVPLTGGKDSSFVLHYTRNVCGMTPLAFTWDNGMIRDGAWQNIRTAVKKLGLDHEVVKYEASYWQKALRASFREVEKVCFCPIFVLSAAIPIAVKHKIPAIITGFSEGQRGIDHTFALPDKEQNLNDIKKFHRIWEAVFRRCIAPHENEAMTAKILDNFFGRLGDCLKKNTDPADYPVVIPLSNYVSWVKRDELEQTLKQHVGWQRPADSFVHTSCFIEPIKGYLEYTGNLNEIHHELSYLVRGGFLSREAAVKELDAMNVHGKEPEAVKPFVKFIAISEDEFRKTVRQGPRWKFLATGVEGVATPKEILDTVAWCMGNKQQIVNYAPKQ